MSDSRQLKFDLEAGKLGFDFSGEIKAGGNYVPVTIHAGAAYVSGQVPRVGDEIVVKGRVGGDISLERGQIGARVSTLRALTVAARAIGGLDRIEQVLKMNVYVQSGEGFHRQSQVGDAASDLLIAILGEAGRHARTSVGVEQLPGNAAVEIDLVLAIK